MATHVQHPRRRLLTGEKSLDQPSPSLKRGATFYSPASPPHEHDPVLDIPSLPRRSPTSSGALQAIISGKQRMSNILDQFDLSALSVNLDTTKQDDEPVPSGLLAVQMSPEEPRPQQPFKEPLARNRHASDSGLGSSIHTITESEKGMATVAKVPRTPADCPSNLSAHKTGHSALNQSMAPSVATPSPEQAISDGCLSPAAVKHIERCILIPILNEEKLKPFHNLVRSVPPRIASKEITSLRDLEHILLWLSPVSSTLHGVGVLGVAYVDVFAKSVCVIPKVSSYLGFCEFTIQRIHMTVAHLNDNERTRKGERPYTNGYFLDLVTQMRRYAAMIAANRARTGAHGQKAPSMCVHPSGNPDESLLTKVSEDRVTLEGGLSETGRPAELVRHVDGKMISLRTGEPYDEKALPTMKRTLSNQSQDEGVLRSMARRKKNAPPMDINQKCPWCPKVFKRPCDYTKHTKTHLRPYKCLEPTCRYYHEGWPTEKERDRHMNDKHSANPVIYKCQFAPCTYTSKRESNCKQHMEKAHGWTYIRSKRTGKNKTQNGTTGATPTPATPSSAAPSSVSPVQQAPSTASPFEQSVTSISPMQTFSVSPIHSTPLTPAMSTPATNLTADLSTPATGPMPSPYEAASSSAASIHDLSPANTFVPMSSNHPFVADPAANLNSDFQLFPDGNFDGSMIDPHTLETIGLEGIGNFDVPMTEQFSLFETELQANNTDGLISPPVDLLSMDGAQFGQYTHDDFNDFSPDMMDDA